MSNQGKLIVLEGTDDAVLHEQLGRLYRWLCDLGTAVEQTQEPTQGPVGAQIRLHQQGRLRLDPASLALFWTADRMDHLGRQEGILSWLAQERHVLCVHYLLFSYAYQPGQVDLDWLRQINVHCPLPDLTLFIDVPVSSDRRPEVERLRGNYMQAIEWLCGQGEHIANIDGRGTEAAVHEACRHQVATLLAQ